MLHNVADSYFVVLFIYNALNTEQVKWTLPFIVLHKTKW